MYKNQQKMFHFQYMKIKKRSCGRQLREKAWDNLTDPGGQKSD